MCDPNNDWPPLPQTGEYSEETYQMFKEAYTCTEEDAKVQFTTEQLKELCLKHKCRVMASRWNIAYEYRLWLWKEGRLQGKSERYERRLVTKGVNRHKHLMLYDENKIKETRNYEWRLRKKDSILSLRMWEYERKKRERRPETEELETSSNSSILSFIANSGGNLTLLPASTEELSNSPEDLIEVVSSSDDKLSQDKLDKTEQGEVAEASKALPNSQVIDEKLCNMFDLNTESMSVSEITSQSLRQIPSQDIFSEDFYEIPCTSTQKETVEIEIVTGI